MTMSKRERAAIQLAPERFHVRDLVTGEVITYCYHRSNANAEARYQRRVHGKAVVVVDTEQESQYLDMVRRALLAYCQIHIANQSGWMDPRGYTCDETGCGICNAGSAEEAAESWFTAWHNGPEDYCSRLPFDPDDTEEMLDLIETAEAEDLS